MQGCTLERISFRVGITNFWALTNVSWMMIPLYSSIKLSAIAFDDRYRQILLLEIREAAIIFFGAAMFSITTIIYSPSLEWSMVSKIMACLLFLMEMIWLHVHMEG